MPKEETILVNFMMPVSLKRRVEAICEKRGMTLSSFIRKGIEEKLSGQMLLFSGNQAELEQALTKVMKKVILEKASDELGVKRTKKRVA